MEVAAEIYEIARQSISTCAAAPANASMAASTASSLQRVEVSQVFEDARIEPYFAEGFFADVPEFYRQIRARSNVTIGVNATIIESSQAASNPLSHV